MRASQQKTFRLCGARRQRRESVPGKGGCTCWDTGTHPSVYVLQFFPRVRSCVPVTFQIRHLSQATGFFTGYVGSVYHRNRCCHRRLKELQRRMAQANPGKEKELQRKSRCSGLSLDTGHIPVTCRILKGTDLPQIAKEKKKIRGTTAAGPCLNRLRIV